MQTFKTAVIVVLMLTVVYGAYVSLTTPPAQLPDDLVTIMETDSGFEQGADSTLESLGISNGMPEGLDDFPGGQGAVRGTAGGGVVGSLSDDHPDAVDQASASPSVTRLPMPPAGATPPQVDASRNYESTTPGTFQLPDPSSLTAPLSEADAESLMSAAGVDAAAAGQAQDNQATPGDGELQLPASAGNTSAGNVGLANAILAADQHVEADRMKEALTTLSLFYSSPDLTESERTQLLSRLDPLAGEVIYSRLHLVEQPYRVGQNETLMEIAAKYAVPWQLLANINGIEDPVVVLPGTELKVVRGPFRAEIDLKRSEMALMLGELYAGRFPITLGQDPSPQPGTYTVQDKQTAKTFYDATGAAIPAGDPRNPFGSVWLDLGQQMCIHGSAESPEAVGNGCIALRAADAEDVYGILSQGSSISIRR